MYHTVILCPFTTRFARSKLTHFSNRTVVMCLEAKKTDE